MSKQIIAVIVGAVIGSVSSLMTTLFLSILSNRRRKKSIQAIAAAEITAIMGKARAVVGVDGGLLHLASCTDVPIVAGFTVVKPHLFTPTRSGVFGNNFYTVVPEADLGCRFCHSQINFINHGDVSTCFYLDNKCLDQMDGYKFINQLENRMNGLTAVLKG